MTPYFTPQTLAEYLNISVQTIYNRLAEGASLPVHTKIGRLVRFSPYDVENWLQDNRHASYTLSAPETKTVSASRRRGRPTKSEQIRLRTKEH